MEFTVTRGRRGFNGVVLAGLSLTEAYKRYNKVDKTVVKSAHEEAVATKKKMDAEAQEGAAKSEDAE